MTIDCPVQYRETEWRLLRSFITPDSQTSVPNVIVSGYKSTGKTHTVLQYLDHIGIRKSIINCDEFVNQKLLLQKCLHSVRADSGVDLSKYHQKFMYKGLEASRMSLLCETFSHFLMALEQFVEETGYTEPHVLVLDRFDQCIEPTNDVFRSFLKFREYSSIRNVSIIYITSHESPPQISTLVAPHVKFGAYTQEQATDILVQSPLPDASQRTVAAPMWPNFAKLMVDLYFDYTGSDLTLLKDICKKIWPKFVNRLHENNYTANDFLKIYRLLRQDLFHDDVVCNSTITEYRTGLEEPEGCGSVLSDLPYHSKFILIASYLASYGDHKSDIQLFSRLKSIKKRPRKNGDTEDIDSRLLSANFFDLERLKAILSVIYRNEAQSLSKDNTESLNLYHDHSERELARKDTEYNTFTLNKSVDLNTQLSTLVSLGLVARTYGSDMLSSKMKWKCNVTWSSLEALSAEIGFPMENYSLER